MTKEDFDKILEKKQDTTEKLLNIQKNLDNSENRYLIASKYESAVKVEKYVKDYVAVDHHAGSSLVPVLNKLVMVAEMRTFDIQQIDYKDRVSVLNTLSENYTVRFDKVDSLADEIENTPQFQDKMQMICNSGLDQTGQMRLLCQLPIIFSIYFSILGSDRIRELRYRKDLLEKELRDLKKIGSETLVTKIRNTFIVGERYSRTFVKDKLTAIYSEMGLTKKPKATDLVEYFEIRDTYLNRKDGSGKRDHGYEILSLKQTKL